MSFEENTDALAEFFVDERISGSSYAKIAQKHGVPVEEVITLVKAYYNDNAIRDPQEYRMLLQLRLEAIINKLWTGLEAGSFKHGEAIIKAVTQLQDLHDLNEKTITHNFNVILDEDASKVFGVLKYSQNYMLEKVMRLPLTAKAKKELEAWPEWAAESATEAVEKVIYAEEVDD